MKAAKRKVSADDDDGNGGDKGEFRKRKLTEKREHYFQFESEASDPDEDGSSPQYLEEGLPLAELVDVHGYFAQRLKQPLKYKKNRSMAKYIRHRNLFFTSGWFLTYHFVQNLIFWLLVIIFPAISVTGCVTGFAWMSHVAMGLFCFLSLVFDCVFAMQYMEREGLKYDLRNFKNGKINRKNRCGFMFMVFLEIIFELIMTQIALFDIYTDIAFATLVNKEGMKALAALSAIGIILIALPKIYAMGLTLLMIFNCSGPGREEDVRRKWAHRILVYNESRMQALNVEYTRFQREKTDLLMASMKFCFEDFPLFIFMLYYLTQTDCGKKNQNSIIYISLILKVINTYFGFFYRILSTCYVWRRLRSYNRKVEVSISPQQLANFGYRNIRQKLTDNTQVESLVLTGETYEYMVIN